METLRFGLSEDEMKVYQELNSLVYRYTKKPFWTPAGMFLGTLLVVNLILGFLPKETLVGLLGEWRTEAWGVLGFLIPLSVIALLLASPIILLHAKRQRRRRTGYYERMLALKEAGKINRVSERFRAADGCIESIRVVGDSFSQAELKLMTNYLIKDNYIYRMYRDDYRDMEATFEKLTGILK